MRELIRDLIMAVLGAQLTIAGAILVHAGEVTGDSGGAEAGIGVLFIIVGIPLTLGAAVLAGRRSTSE